MFVRLFAAEIRKSRRSMVWLLALLGPVVTVILGTANYFRNASIFNDPGENSWINLYTQTVIFYGMLFLPVLAGIFAALVCRSEHTSGGWKQLLALPVPRGQVYLAKLLLVATLLALTQLLFLLGLVAASVASGLGDQIEWEMLVGHLSLGWVATLPLAAIQLWVSVLWASFGLPLAINVALTLPAVLVVNSATFGPFYPWAQPLLVLSPETDLNPTTFGILVGSTLAIAVLGGLWHFRHRDVTN